MTTAVILVGLVVWALLVYHNAAAPCPCWDCDQRRSRNDYTQQICGTCGRLYP